MGAPSISTILSPFFMPAFSATAFLITSPTSGYKRGIIPISITSVFSPNMFFPVFFSGVTGSSIIFPSLSILKRSFSPRLSFTETSMSSHPETVLPLIAVILSPVMSPAAAAGEFSMTFPT